MTQRALGDRVGLGQARISDLERGEGGAAPLDTWVAISMALNRPIAIAFSRDLEPESLRDAGHLGAQEIVLGFARRVRRRVDVELPSRPANPTLVIDVVMQDDRARALIVTEIWNRLDDLGAAFRSTSRKVAEAEGLAVLASGDGDAYRVCCCWLLVDTAANRRLVAAYPGVLRARYPGSSVAWVRSLVEGSPPPSEPGIAWVDTRNGRVIPLRLRPMRR
jgi:hypothetical protein